MKQILILLAIMLLSISVMAQERAQGQVLVRLEGNLCNDKIQSFTEEYAQFNIQHIYAVSERLNIHLFSYNEAFTRSAGVSIVDEINTNNTDRAEGDRRTAQYNFEVSHRGAWIPDDTRFGEQWALRNTGQTVGGLAGIPGADISATEAWYLVYNNPDRNNRQIVVAIVDDGFRLTHNDINFVTGRSFYSNMPEGVATIPNRLHGTHVAGIAGGIGNNNLGIAGVAWDTYIMPVAIPLSAQDQVGPGTFVDRVIRAYDWVMEQRILYNTTDGAEGYFVVATNSSFGIDRGNPLNFPLWRDMYDSLGKAGILSAVAVANIGLNVDVEGDVPGAMVSPWLISTTNTNNRDQRNSNAAWGLNTVDLGAPGTGILSANSTGDNAFTSLTGTSMATPMVAGTVGLMFAAASEALLTSYSPDSLALLFRRFLVEGVDPNTSLNNITRTGGRLNARNAVYAVMNHPVIRIALSQTGTYTFANATFGYDEQPSFEVTIENIGRLPVGELTIALSGENYSSFTLSREIVSGVEVDSIDSFAVVPNIGLDAGTYTATITVSGENISESFDVSFTVNRADGLDVETPAFASKTYNAITVYAVTPPDNEQIVEYAIYTTNNADPAELTWQTDTTFGRLLPETDYFVYARTAQSANFEAGEHQVSAVITTYPLIFKIALNQSKTEPHIFTSVALGYDANELTPFDVIITNVGNQPIGTMRVALSGENASSFRLSRTILPGIAVAGTGNFTVVPNVGLAIGTYTAIVTVTEAINEISEYFEVSFTVSDPTNISVIEQDGGWIVFPNPVTDKLQVASNKLQVGDIIELFDVNGRRVFSQPTCNLQLATCNFTIDISHLPNGNYILRIGNRAVQIVKQ